MHGGEAWAAKDGCGCEVCGGARPRTDEIETNGEQEPEQLMASARSAAHVGSRKRAREEDKGRRDISCVSADSDHCWRESWHVTRANMVFLYLFSLFAGENVLAAVKMIYEECHSL